eukprot:2694065-Prorocentrum_lima.AAC.1
MPVPAAKRNMGRRSLQHLAVSPALACWASRQSPQANPCASAVCASPGHGMVTASVAVLCGRCPRL